MVTKYDIVATVGQYTDKQGENKKRYKNVGVVKQGENGPYILMDKTFNPAGLAEKDRDSIILSLFEPKPREQSNTRQSDLPPNDSPADDFPI